MYIQTYDVCLCARPWSHDSSFHLEVRGPSWFFSVSLRPTKASRFSWEDASSRPAPAKISTASTECTSVHIGVHPQWFRMNHACCGLESWNLRKHVAKMPYALRANWTSGITVGEMWPDQSFRRRTTRWQVAESVDLIDRRLRRRPEWKQLNQLKLKSVLAQQYHMIQYHVQKDTDCMNLLALTRHLASGTMTYDFTCLSPQLPLSGPPCLSSRIGFGNFPGLARVWWVFSWTS